MSPTTRAARRAELAAIPERQETTRIHGPLVAPRRGYIRVVALILPVGNSDLFRVDLAMNNQRRLRRNRVQGRSRFSVDPLENSHGISDCLVEPRHRRFRPGC